MADKMTIIRDLKLHLQAGFNTSVKEIILFGSRVNGNSNDTSDYDVLIVLDHIYTAGEEDKIYELCYDIELKYNIIIDAHLISQPELKTIRGKQPLFTKAIQTGLYA